MTVVAIGAMVARAMQAAAALAESGTEVEVIDPITLVPLDMDAIIASVRKTGRLVVVDEDNPVCSIAEHIIGTVTAQALERVRLLHTEHSAREAAEEANRAKTQFLATMSHELRTPLNAISGYAELLSLGLRGPTTPEQQEDLGRIMRSQRHLLSVINDILNFARLEAGHVEYRIADVPVADLISDLEPLIRPQLVAKQLERPVIGRQLDFGRNRRVVLARTQQAGVRPGSQRQAEGIEEDRFARAGLPGEHAQPRLELELELVDEHDVPDGELPQH